MGSVTMSEGQGAGEGTQPAHSPQMSKGQPCGRNPSLTYITPVLGNVVLQRFDFPHE